MYKKALCIVPVIFNKQTDIKMSLMPFSRDIFSPAEEFFGIRPFELGFSGKELGTLRAMPLDVVEKDSAFEVKADIPGVGKDDIHVEVDDNMLTIKVDKSEEQKEDKEEDGVKWHRFERSSSFVQRSLRMPENAALDSIKAKYDKGVLTLSVPKKQEEKKTNRVMIE